MGISLSKGGRRAKSSEDLWHPAEISAVFVSQCTWFTFSSTVAGEQDVRLQLSRAALWGMCCWTGRSGQTTYWLHRSIPFVILAHETLPNFSASKIIWNSLSTWGWGFRLFKAACSDSRQCKDTAERTLQWKAKKSSVCQKVELKGLPWEL